MRILFLDAVLFCTLYSIMKNLKQSWEKRQIHKWSRYILGILAWGILISFLGILWGLAQPIIELFTAPTDNTPYDFVIVAWIIITIAHLTQNNPELLDIESMKPFLKESLAFENPERSRVNLEEELDKHEVRRVYKEITGKNLLDDNLRNNRELKEKFEATKENVAYSKDTCVPASKELLAALQKPIESPHMNEELKQLQQGSIVDISNSWFLYRMRKSSHKFFHLVKQVQVNPISGKINFVLESNLFTNEKVKNPACPYGLKQDLYEFLQGVNQQDWMQPYLNYVSHISCICCQLEDQIFGGFYSHQVFRAEITRAYLKANENQNYDAGKMNVDVLV